ncbi:MAG TPA: SDR family NAD(P)-dependent oxidoreductase [Vicinamibacterales bacterium]|nr:SDR family NAD(P)-dependent oxidoreductase [Vicinamibacterales bacterium]
MPPPVAFVTGAGRGVGRAIALRLARDGYAVALAGRSAPPVEEVAADIGAAGGEALPLVCDVAVRHDVYGAVGRAEARLGPIEVLVNNAGISESAPFAAMDDAMWERTLAVNLTGTYHCMRAVVPGMFARRRGRVINVASTAAKVGYPYTAAYVASKHGVLGLTRAVALEAASRGVTVNAICPGWIDTGMTGRAIARIVEKTGRAAEDARRALEQMNPSGRLLDPDEVAAVAAYLASPAADGVNGQALDV